MFWQIVWVLEAFAVFSNAMVGRVWPSLLFAVFGAGAMTFWSQARAERKDELTR